MDSCFDDHDYDNAASIIDSEIMGIENDDYIVQPSISHTEAVIPLSEHLVVPAQQAALETLYVGPCDTPKPIIFSTIQPLLLSTYVGHSIESGGGTKAARARRI